MTDGIEGQTSAVRGDGAVSRRPTREEQISGRCKHFTGVRAERCAAGVRYEDVKGRVPGAGPQLPCVLRLGGDAIGCASREFPTTEEVAAKIERQNQQLRDMVTARKAIVDALGPYKKGKSRDAAGTVYCPVCKTGRLHHRRAAYNGHVHARCSTEGCVAWME